MVQYHGNFEEFLAFFGAQEGDKINQRARIHAAVKVRIGQFEALFNSHMKDHF